MDLTNTFSTRTKVIAALICALFITSTLQANSATISGTKCTKVNSTKTAGNTKYTCVKSGKKLVWNKGVALKPAPSASPSPTPSASKSSEPAPTPSVSTSATPIPTATPTFTPPAASTSFDNLIENYKGIAYAAWSKSRAKIQSSNAKANNFNLYIGANTVIPNKNPQAAYDLVARLYDGFVQPKRTDVLAFGWTDRDWAENQMKTLMPTSEWRWLKTTACATKETCWGGGAFTDNEGNFLLVITTEVVDDNHTSGTLEAHEFTHGIQQAQFGKPQPWPPLNTWPPTWIVEGQAEFSQNAAIFNESYDEYIKNRYAVSQNLFKNPAYDSAFFSKYFILNPPQSWYDTNDRWLQYDAGGMLVEILVALNGPDSIMNLWLQMGKGSTFHEAFKNIYGTDFDKALPIIAKAIALEVGKS